MEQDYSYGREEEIDLVAILALGFRHLKFVLLCSVIGVALVLGIHILKSKTEKAITDYTIECEEYEAKAGMYRNDIDTASGKLASLRKYNSESLYMKLNATDFYTAKAILAVVCEDTVIMGDNGSVIMPASVVISQYAGLWNSADFSEVLKTDVPADYLKQVISFKTEKNSNSNSNSNIMTVYAYANTADEARSVADSMCAYLESTREDVSVVSFNHQLKRVSQTVVEKSNSLDIVARQTESRKEESKLADDILKAGKELKKLEKEEPSLLHPVKYSAIGFMAGFFLSCLYLLISFIGKGMVYSSSYMAERFGLTYFGSLNRKEKLFLHEKILSEKLWSRNDAAVFISENVKNRIAEGSKVLVMSSGSVCKEDEKVIADCLLKQKMVLSFVQSAQTNSETVGKVKDCDCVILLEKTWTAGRRDVEQSVILAQKFEKPVSGFVTILD